MTLYRDAVALTLLVDLGYPNEVQDCRSVRIYLETIVDA